MVALVDGNVMVVASVPDSVRLLFAVSVLPLAIVRVAEVAGAVIATLLMDVAEATPNVGVTSVGELANTRAPLPVSSVTAVAKFADDGVAKNVATPVPRPEIPVDTGNPVALVNVPDEGVPKAPPFTTKAPAEPTLTAKAVATLVPNPETPVPIGRPVALVNVTEVGVPRIGVTRVGLVDSTLLPVPVLVVTPVPPLATANVPASVTAPEVAVLGVRPVVPALKVVTPIEDNDVHCGAVPVDVST
jgi:hypothetical protein